MDQQSKTTNVNCLEITTNSPAIGQSILPEQRIQFAKDFEKLFHDKGINATVTTHGDQQRLITISGKIVNEPSVRRMKDNAEAIQDLRGNGFKHLVMTDGKFTWDIDLKN
jgi:hypothetical protein